MHALVVGLAQRALFAAGNDTLEVQPLDGTLLCYIPFFFFLSFQYVLVTTPFASTQACIKSQVSKDKLSRLMCYRCDQVTKNQRGREVNAVWKQPQKVTTSACPRVSKRIFPGSVARQKVWNVQKNSFRLAFKVIRGNHLILSARLYINFLSCSIIMLLLSLFSYSSVVRFIGKSDNLMLASHFSVKYRLCIQKT